MSEPEVGTEPVAAPAAAREQSSHRGRWTAIISAVAVAVAGATAAAVITPQRIDAIFGWFEPAATATAAPTKAAVPMQSVASTEGALTLEIPEDWSSRQSRWNVTEDGGTGVLVGTQLSGTLDFRSDGAWVGASSEVVQAANVVDMTAAEREQWIEAFVDVDWTIDGCVPVSAEPRSRPGWTMATRTWKECASTKGQRMVEFAALADDLEVLVIGQVSITKEVSDEVFDAIVSTFVVAPDKLPSTAASSDLVAP